jgi:hypothetical protein
MQFGSCTEVVLCIMPYAMLPVLTDRGAGTGPGAG